MCNLCFIARIQEYLVISQVSSYLNSCNLYKKIELAYDPGDSTETAPLKVVSNLFLSLNIGNMLILALVEHLTQLITLSLHTISSLTLDLLTLSSSGFHLI